MNVIKIIRDPDTLEYYSNITNKVMYQDGVNGAGLQTWMSFSLLGDYMVFIYDYSSSPFVYGFYSCDFDQYYSTSSPGC